MVLDAVEKYRVLQRDLINRVRTKFDLLLWTKEGFDLGREMKARTGPFVEIGGPSPEYKMFPRYRLDRTGKPYFVSNIDSAERVDFVADGRQMPLPDASVGALFMTSITRYYRADILKEAARILEPGGLVIMQNLVNPEDIDAAQKNGFEFFAYEFDLDPRWRAFVTSDPSDVKAVTEEVRAAARSITHTNMSSEEFDKIQNIFSPSRGIFQKPK